MTLVEAAQLAPLVTASVALLAATIAVVAIFVQRKVARTRAAIDFFLKAEMDEKMREVYDRYEEGIKELRAVASMDEFRGSERYNAITRYLDILELFAVGIHNKILDHRICYHYWADLVRDTCQDAWPVINHVRGRPGNAHSYEQIVRLNALWSTTPRRWQRWRDEF